MEPSILNDYRCDCGKLLFKGLLLSCKLEIKCKRCGTIKTVIVYADNKNGRSIDLDKLSGCDYSAKIGANGKFLTVDGKLADALGHLIDEMSGKSLLEFVSPTQEKIKEKFLILAQKQQAFRILDLNFIVKGGEDIGIDVYFVPYYDVSVFAGYAMVGWLLK